MKKAMKIIGIILAVIIAVAAIVYARMFFTLSFVSMSFSLVLSSVLQSIFSLKATALFRRLQMTRPAAAHGTASRSLSRRLSFRRMENYHKHVFCG